jgi:hypothetical protein
MRDNVLEKGKKISMGQNLESMVRVVAVARQ